MTLATESLANIAGPINNGYTNRSTVEAAMIS